MGTFVEYYKKVPHTLIGISVVPTFVAYLIRLTHTVAFSKK